jgi:hypothetical protein
MKREYLHYLLIFFIIYFLLFTIKEKRIEGIENNAAISDKNERITGTLFFNADIIQSAGIEGSVKRKKFRQDFKDDLINLLNKDTNIILLNDQIKIKKIYYGSIIIDFEIYPDSSGNSIEKDYLVKLLTGKKFFPTIKLHTTESVKDVMTTSWPLWFF